MGKIGHSGKMSGTLRCWRVESAVSNVTVAQNAGSQQVWFEQTTRTLWTGNQVGGGIGDTYRKELFDFF